MLEEQQFWTWFKHNEAKFFFLNQIDDKMEIERLLDELLEHLHSYCAQLYFELGGEPDQKQDLIITAEGNENFFNKVESLVKQAPQLEYWNIIAFKPIRENYVTEFEGIELDPKTIWFMPVNNKSTRKLGLKIYIENYDSSRDEDFLMAAYLMLDNILGEKSNALNVGHIEIESWSTFQEKENLIELVNLPKYIEWKRHKNKL